MTAPVLPPATAVVTGANSGIGRATAIHLAELGYRTIGTVRRLDAAGKLLQLAEEAGVTVELEIVDAADDDSVREGFGRILAEGPVDVLVANAGVGGNGVLEDTPVDRYRDVMEVNCFGVIRCAQQVLPGMRDRGRGAIAIVSSVVGKVASLAQSPYVVSKWAVEGVAEGLAQEVAGFGIRVVVVEPGITKSAIFAKNVDGADEGPYAPHYRRLFQLYGTAIPQATPASEAAEVIAEAIRRDEYVLRHPCSWGGPELIAGRASITDEQWVSLGEAGDDADYYERFRQLLGVDIRP